MSTTVGLVDRTTTTNPQVNAKCVYVGTCSTAAANVAYDVDNPDTVASTVGGYGPLVEGVAAAVRQSASAQVALPVQTTGVGTISAVANSGSGPAITAGGTARDNLTLKLKITASGALGTSRFAWACDGASYQGEDYTPTPTSAQITGTVDYTTFTWGAAGTLDTLTLKADADVGALITATFAAPTSADDAVTQFNAAMVAGGSSARLKTVQGKFFQVYSTTLGAASTVLIDATSTADTVALGANGYSVVSGAAATFAVPNTGVTFTFTAGAYVAGDIYTCTTTAPHFSATELGTALDALLADRTKIWDDIVILQPCIDGAETLAFLNAISAKLTTWRGTEPKRATVVFLNSAIGATGSGNITTNDTDVKAALTAFEDPYLVLVHGDGFALGTEFPGKPRRPLVHGVGVLAASRRYSADLGSRDFDAIPEFDLVGPDGATKARDENTATVKMYARQSAGQRFTVAKFEDGQAFIVKGVTRAKVSSKFRHVGVMRVGRAALNLAYAQAKAMENTDPLLSGKGTLRAPFAASKDKAIENVFRAALQDPGHVSDLKIRLDRNEKVSSTDNVTITGEVLPRGQAESVKFTIGVVSELAAT